MTCVAVPPHTRIAQLRQARGESLEAFGRAIGVASKGRVSEIERGLRAVTPEQALAIERVSAGSVDAGDLNAIIAAARMTQDTLAAQIAAEDERVIICAECDEPRPDPAVRACPVPECPHALQCAAVRGWRPQGSVIVVCSPSFPPS